jgi:hypothetical protein
MKQRAFTGGRYHYWLEQGSFTPAQPEVMNWRHTCCIRCTLEVA